jgi:hypothetical protein
MIRSPRHDVRGFGSPFGALQRVGCTHALTSGEQTPLCAALLVLRVRLGTTPFTPTARRKHGYSSFDKTARFGLLPVINGRVETMSIRCRFNENLIDLTSNRHHSDKNRLDSTSNRHRFDENLIQWTWFRPAISHRGLSNLILGYQPLWFYRACAWKYNPWQLRRQRHFECMYPAAVTGKGAGRGGVGRGGCPSVTLIVTCCPAGGVRCLESVLIASRIARPPERPLFVLAGTLPPRNSEDLMCDLSLNWVEKGSMSGDCAAHSLRMAPNGARAHSAQQSIKSFPSGAAPCIRSPACLGPPIRLPG